MVQQTAGLPFGERTDIAYLTFRMKAVALLLWRATNHKQNKDDL
ncbi:hypothetical protein [Bacterioplanoides sp.]